MINYPAGAVWSVSAWAVLGIISVLAFSLYSGRLLRDVWAWFRSGAWRSRPDDPALLIYLVGLGTDEGVAYSKSINYTGKLLPSYLILDRQYVLAGDGNAPTGYSEIDARNYTSWLEGGDTHQVHVYKRNSAEKQSP